MRVLALGLVLLLLAPAAVGQLQMTLSQPGGPGTLEIRNTGLIIGREYYNLFTINEPCPGGLGTGPYLGLCTGNIAFLLMQMSAPVGVWPFHFIAPPASLGTTVWPISSGIPAGLTIEGVAFEIDPASGAISATSPVASVTTS